MSGVHEPRFAVPAVGGWVAPGGRLADPLVAGATPGAW